MKIEEKYLSESVDNKKALKAINDGMKAINNVTKNVPMTQTERKDIFSRAWMFLSQKKIVMEKTNKDK